MIKPHPCAKSLWRVSSVAAVLWNGFHQGFLLLHHFRDSSLVLMLLNYITVDKKREKSGSLQSFVLLKWNWWFIFKMLNMACGNCKNGGYAKIQTNWQKKVYFFICKLTALSNIILFVSVQTMNNNQISRHDQEIKYKNINKLSKCATSGRNKCPS